MANIGSVGDFISRILGRTANRKLKTAYRGHESSAYTLKPAIFRTQAHQENEHLYLRELIAAHPHEFSADATAMELLVRMQHYTLPTRLLDASWNPLVALYFACQPKKKRVLTTRAGKTATMSVEADGEVVILSVPTENIRYFDSDAVAIHSNLARLRFDHKEDIEEKRTNGEIDNHKFNESEPIRRLFYYTCQEKSYFEPRMTWRGLNGIYLVKPKQNNRRILAQDGAFFIFGLTKELRERNEQKILVERIVISAESKAAILMELDRLAFNEKTMFPELDRAARYITRNLNPSALLADLIG